MSGSISVSNGLAGAQAEEMARRVRILQAVRKAVKDTSFSVERRIKGPPREGGMPRLTGRAAGSWGHFTPGLISNNKDASAIDAIWKEAPDGLSITQGTNVEYVQYLNEGHSQQAPAGFLDAAEEKGMEELDKLVSDLMSEF